MPFLQKSHSKGSHYYVEFLGWMECYGVRGERHTQPVITELRRRQHRKSADKPPKLTILVTKEELQISQDVDSKKKNGTKTVQFPKIPGRDVTFVHQASRPGDGRPDDIVACIYLGYMPRTNRCVHVHVYRFADSAVAADFTTKMAAIVSKNSKHTAEVERKLAIDKQIEPPADLTSEPHTTDSAVGSASSGYSGDDDIPVSGSRKMDPDLESLADVMAFDNVNDELRFRMKSENPPVLYPPIDYDTISRKHGNLIKLEERRCKEENIVGELADKFKLRNASNESGVDVSPPPLSAVENSTRHKIPEAPPIAPFLNEAAPSLVSKAAIPPPISKSTIPPPAPKPTVPPPVTKAVLPNEAAPADIQVKPVESGLRRQLSQKSPPFLPQPDMVYPPKKSSPPMSPRLYRQALDNAHSQLYRQNSSHSIELGPALPRQNSGGSNGPPSPFLRQSSSSSLGGVPPFHRQNSSGSNNSFRLSQASDHDKSQEEGKIMYYKGSNNSEDLYTLAMKGPHSGRHSQASDTFPPADYNDGVDMRKQGRSLYRQPHLTRSMPADLIRSEIVLGSSGSRPGSGEFRQIRRTDSPTFVGGSRNQSPVVFAKRVDSPAFLQGSQGFPMY